MKKLSILSSIIIVQFLLLNCECGWWSKSKAFKVTDENYRKVIGGQKHVVVKFYTPWCTWCQRMNKDYEALYEHFKNHPHIIIAGVNCQDEQEVCDYLGVRGYPQIHYYKPKSRKKFNEFTGSSRDTKSFIRYV